MPPPWPQLPVLTAHVVVDDSCFHDGHVPQLLDELQECLASGASSSGPKGRYWLSRAVRAVKRPPPLADVDVPLLLGDVRDDDVQPTRRAACIDERRCTPSTVGSTCRGRLTPDTIARLAAAKPEVRRRPAPRKADRSEAGS